MNISDAPRSATRFPLRRFALCAPDAALAYWFVSHDFAGALGVEYSRDAAKELEALLRDLCVRIDYEADDVTLRIKSKDDVLPALRLIYARAGWDTAELDAIEVPVRDYKRPRPRKVAEGDAFLIPLGGEVFGLGQVLDNSDGAPTVAVFPWIGSASDVQQRDPRASRPLTILHLGLGCSLFTGEWPVVASHQVVHSPSAGPGGARNAVGARSYGGDGPVVELLRAHAGLDTWEQGFADPGYLRKLVLRS